MKFGWLAFHEAVQPEELVDQAVLAEQVGFDAVFGSDHFHPWVDDVSASGFVWSWFGAVAARTSTVELATSVTCPIFHYHPALIAQAAATIDRLSGGRFFLGVGTGENINSGPMGYAFPGYAERISRMGEALEIMQRLLAGEKVDYAGEHYTVDKAKLYSPPVSPVPVLLGAGGPKSATFAGTNAGGLITSVKDPEVALERVIEPFRASAAEAGNPDPTVMATRWLVLAENDADAWQAVAPMRGMRAEGRLEAVDPAVLRERADQMDRADVIGSYTVVRNADEIIDAYRPLVTDIGASYISLQVASVDTVATIELLGRDVLPALREMAAD
ncbi:MAG: TIGR03557 family F420-dependent LLM class oxidoreductase [Actinomycetota bacterium]